MKSIRGSGFWLFQATAILGLFVWAILDPAVDLMVYRLHLGAASPVSAVVDSARHVGVARVVAVCTIVVLACLAFLLRLLAMFHHVSINHKLVALRSLLGLTTIFAVWCSFAVNYSSVSMRAKGVRIVWNMQELESLASPLRNEWPQVDGELPSFGRFMAYPFGRPTTLLLLKPPVVSRGELSISTVERDVSGAIKFLLGSETSGTDYGDWVEWHPQGSVPQTFVGGLNDPHELRSSIELGSGWFLVRYEA